MSANLIGGIPLVVVMITQAVKMGGLPPDFATTMDFTLLGISQNAGLLLMLIPFAVALFFCILFVRILHSRSFSETVNGTGKVRWSHAFAGFGIWFLLMAIYLLVSFAINPDNFVILFDIKTFLPLLLIAVLFIPLQTTCEEFLFRGYLTQGIGVWTKNRWLAIIIPAILFALMHIANPEVSKYGFWEVMPQYFIFGLIFGLTAILDDGIELAIGMHTANNLFACLFITFDASALSTPAIFHQQAMNIGVETIVLFVAGILAIGFFTWKYKWDFRIMNQKVKRAVTIHFGLKVFGRSAKLEEKWLIYALP